MAQAGPYHDSLTNELIIVAESCMWAIETYQTTEFVTIVGNGYAPHTRSFYWKEDLPTQNWQDQIQFDNVKNTYYWGMVYNAVISSTTYTCRCPTHEMTVEPVTHVNFGSPNPVFTKQCHCLEVIYEKSIWNRKRRALEIFFRLNCCV